MGLLNQLGVKVFILSLIRYILRVCPTNKCLVYSLFTNNYLILFCKVNFEYDSHIFQNFLGADLRCMNSAFLPENHSKNVPGLLERLNIDQKPCPNFNLVIHSLQECLVTLVCLPFFPCEGSRKISPARGYCCL